MRAPFDRPIAVELGRGLDELRAIVEENRLQWERDLGGPLRFDRRRPGDGRWVIRHGGHVARLWLNRPAATLLTEGPETDDLFDALSLMHDLWWAQDGEVVAADCGTAHEAVERVRTAVGRVWPSFELHEIDWDALTTSWGHLARSSSDPIGDLKRWVAQLGDPHTAVRPNATPGRLPYRARADGERLRLVEVPDGTAGHRAGARPGDHLVGIDMELLEAEQPVRPHSRDLLLGLAALRGPVGAPASLRTDRGPAWTEPYRAQPWPEPLETRLLDSGDRYIRLRGWMPSLEQALHDALDAAQAGSGLVLDLRGNGGGNFLMATRARGRFLGEDRQVGWIRYRHPRGHLTDPDPIMGSASSGRRVTCPVQVWIDAETYSASEDFLMGLAEEENIEVLGEPSGGGSGRLRSFRLLPGWHLTVTTSHTLTNDGAVIEGSGHAVTGPLPDEA